LRHLSIARRGRCNVESCDMALTLSQDVERQVEERVRLGEFATPDDVVRAAMSALRLVEESGLDDQTLDAIDEAEDDIARGDVQDWAAIRRKLAGA
jgi:Arc/MetJ-type ribon-helix-helix transcriptional regulator